MKQIRLLTTAALLLTATAALGACGRGDRSTDSAYGGTTTGAAMGTTTGTITGQAAGNTTNAMPMDSTRRDSLHRDSTAKGTKRP